MLLASFYLRVLLINYSYGYWIVLFRIINHLFILNNQLFNWLLDCFILPGYWMFILNIAEWMAKKLATFVMLGAIQVLRNAFFLVIGHPQPLVTLITLDHAPLEH